MLNGCQCVWPDEREARAPFQFPLLLPHHLSLIPRRLQGDVQNSIPAVCVSVEHIIRGRWHLPLSNVNITASNDSYLTKDALTSSMWAPTQSGSCSDMWWRVCMWMLTGQRCWMMGLCSHGSGIVWAVVSHPLVILHFLISTAMEMEGLRSSHQSSGRWGSCVNLNSTAHTPPPLHTHTHTKPHGVVIKCLVQSSSAQCKPVVVISVVGYEWWL